MRITGGRKYKSLAVSMMCMIVLGSMFSLISVMPYVNLQYLAYVFSVIHRAFTYGGNAAVIAMCFPIQYFGKLYGISQVSLKLVYKFLNIFFSKVRHTNQRLANGQSV